MFLFLKMGLMQFIVLKVIKLIKAIADEGIPVVGHTGFIPYKSTFYGGFKAYGKNANEAKKIYDQTLKLQDAGAICN